MGRVPGAGKSPAPGYEAYSIQRLKRRKPEWFEEDLSVFLELLRQKKPPAPTGCSAGAG